MAKAHYWNYLKDIEGKPVEGATVLIYNAGTSAQSYIFEGEDDTIASNTVTLITDSDGLFEFWIGDRREINGYPVGSKFKITWEKTGRIESGYIDDVEIWNDKNKASVYSETIEQSMWTYSSPGYKYIDITHNLDEPYVYVACYGNLSKSSVPITLQYINDNIIRIIVTDEYTLKSHITVIG